MKRAAIIVALLMVAVTASDAMAFGFGPLSRRGAFRQGRRQGIRQAAAVNAFQANTFAPVRFVAPAVRVNVGAHFVAPVRQRVFVQPQIYQRAFVQRQFVAPVVRRGYIQQFAAPPVILQQQGGCAFSNCKGFFGGY